MGENAIVSPKNSEIASIGPPSNTYPAISGQLPALGANQGGQSMTHYGTCFMNQNCFPLTGTVEVHRFE